MLCLAALSAEAVPYWDNDLLVSTLTQGESFHDNFNIAGGDGDLWDSFGYDSASQSITSAFATFTFLDLNWRSETKVEIDLGSSNPFASVTSLVLPFFVSGDILGQALLDLSSDGVLGYSVSNTGNSTFTLLSASLSVNASPRAVPDGGTTLGLLGLGLVATALLARRSGAKRFGA